MIFVATQNFGTVDRVLAAPPHEAEQMFQTLGPENARLLLRYLAGEENRLFFVSWEWAQIGLGLALTAALLLAIKNRLLGGMAGAMVIIALFQRFRVTPEMIALGRTVDFVPWLSESAARDQYWKISGVYLTIEAVKYALLIGLLIAMFAVTRKRARRSAEEGELVGGRA